jgi:hypothetical protein
LTVLGAVTLAQRVWSAVTKVVAAGSSVGVVDGVVVQEEGLANPAHATDPSATLGA